MADTTAFFLDTLENRLCSQGHFSDLPHKMGSHVPFLSKLAHSLQHDDMEQEQAGSGLHPSSAPYCMVQTLKQVG